MINDDVPHETIRRSANEAYAAGKSIHECPDDMLPHQLLWCRYFRENYFNQDGEGESCS